MNARSALESLAIAAFACACGFFLCYFWTQARDAKAEAASAAEYVAAIQNAAPEIARQVSALGKVTATGAKLNAQIAANAAAIQSLSACPVPAELQRLHVERVREINANASSADDRKAD